MIDGYTFNFEGFKHNIVIINSSDTIFNVYSSYYGPTGPIGPQGTQLPKFNYIGSGLGGPIIVKTNVPLTNNFIGASVPTGGYIVSYINNNNNSTNNKK